MRDHLIGYLLDALEPSEHESVEAQLSRDPQLKRELELLARSLRPLAADKAHFEPPPGLAQRACEFVVSQSRATVAASAAALGPSRWRLADLVVAAGIFLAASLLFFPAILQSRFAARVTKCQNNLRQIGVGLADYSTLHDGYFPNIPLDGRLAAAGVYALRLDEQRLLADHQILICPDSALAGVMAGFRVPSRDDLRGATGARLAELLRLMGGSYGYNIGYVLNGQYQSTKNLHRLRFALMSDAPSDKAPFHSLNHDCCGQNVLFEDGHVQYLTTCKAQGCNDNIFLNDRGERAPGTHPHDSVIFSSDGKPLAPRP